MAWYDSGTVKVTVNSATVTGTGTKWLAGARQGEAFVAPDGRLYEVLNIASDTSLTLTKPYIGATATGQKYALAPMQGYVKELADRVSALLLLSQEELGSVLKAADLQATPNDATNGKILTVGRSFGLGSSSAGSSYDKFPSASLNDDGIPSGFYWASSPIADLPQGFGSGLLIHRQIGTTGAQILINGSSGVMFYRGRVGSVWLAWKTSLAVGDFGLGSGTAAPPNGRTSVNPFGWYYQTTTPAWGGGSFFLDMPYGSWLSAGLRLSTDPYSENFYLQGGVKDKKEYNRACKLVHDKNIVGSVANGSVIESGFNANGKWAKFADGTLICFSPPIRLRWIDVVDGPIYTAPETYWDFPVAFLNSDNYVISMDSVGSNAAIWPSLGPTRTASRIGVKLNAAYRWDQEFFCRVSAIGRWKA